MTRTFNTSFRADFESPRAQNPILVFLTLSHPSWATPIWVVNDVVNYTWNGHVYIGFPFNMEYLADDEKVPRGQLTIQNVDRVLGQEILNLVYGPYLEIDVLSAADWTSTIDATSNSRLPLGTPTLELSAQNLQLWDVTVTSTTIVASFGPPDTTRELWPKSRCTKANTPGLFR